MKTIVRKIEKEKQIKLSKVENLKKKKDKAPNDYEMRYYR